MWQNAECVLQHGMEAMSEATEREPWDYSHVIGKTADHLGDGINWARFRSCSCGMYSLGSPCRNCQISGSVARDMTGEGKRHESNTPMIALLALIVVGFGVLSISMQDAPSRADVIERLD